MDAESVTEAGRAERLRVAEADAHTVAWRRWGPYLAERAWGTVREDYSPNGTAWDYFPHDHARSRVYRWSEDGLAGLCDEQQQLCVALAFWNGQDPIIKERIFGLTGNEGNHGEDAKEYWWFLDSTPTHSYMRWAYAYPQRAFPYDALVHHGRGRHDPELELLDTGVFDDDRYWWIEAEYAKGTPDDIHVRVRVTNCGPDTATIEVLPHLWFRNTWSWGDGEPRPKLWAEDDRVVAEHHILGRYVLSGDRADALLFCENESNTMRLFGIPGTRYPKDGINDHVVHAAATVNPAGVGTKAALRYQRTVAPGATTEIVLHLGPQRAEDVDGLPTSTDVLATRRAEADGFYASITPPKATPDEARVMRQAFAGLLWTKQWFHLDVDRWLRGDPGQPPPPATRSRNAGWRHLNNQDVVSMPDTWEYPWYAAWDLAFHCVALAHVDPGFAKDQLLLLCREWYMHPNGQLPAYEWAFSDVNPPVHAWAALQVFEIDGRRDMAFLERIFHKLLVNFTWWVNRKDSEGNNIFEGGFLGLDNIGPFDRSAGLPKGVMLEQSDGTAWMAKYCLDMLQIALVLAVTNRTYEDIATKFFEHFTYIASAMNEAGLWDEEDGFYYDVVHLRDGSIQRLRYRSTIGLLPLAAVAIFDDEGRMQLPDFMARTLWFLHNRPDYAKVVAHSYAPGVRNRALMSIADPQRLRRIIERVLADERFLSPHGLRSLSRDHLAKPFEFQLDGTTYRVDYQPAESTSWLFGGNSNWRGPVWFPTNYLVIEGLHRFGDYVGDDYVVELPTGSGRTATLHEVADDLADRLISLFLLDGDGHRPCYGDVERFRTVPLGRDSLLLLV